MYMFVGLSGGSLCFKISGQFTVWKHQRTVFEGKGFVDGKLLMPKF